MPAPEEINKARELLCTLEPRCRGDRHDDHCAADSVAVDTVANLIGERDALRARIRLMEAVGAALLDEGDAEISELRAAIEAARGAKGDSA
jgi:hypothetical protein